MNGQMSLRRGFKINKNEKILVVEDVITTGGSVKEVIDVVHKNHGQVIGVGIIVDRSNGQVKIHENQKSLVSLKVESFSEDDIPDSLKSIPIQKPEVGVY